MILNVGLRIQTRVATGSEGFDVQYRCGRTIGCLGERSIPLVPEDWRFDDHVFPIWWFPARQSGYPKLWMVYGQWKIHHMDDDWGYPHDYGPPQVWVSCNSKMVFPVASSSWPVTPLCPTPEASLVARVQGSPLCCWRCCESLSRTGMKDCKQLQTML